MTTTLRLAHLSDIHVDARAENQSFMANETAVQALPAILETLNRDDRLDAVLVSGDAVNQGHRAEFDRFATLMAVLEKPWFVVPGNHDGNLPVGPDILSQRDFSARFNPQHARRPETGQAGYFSVMLNHHWRLIGLDSAIPGEVGGRVDAAQLAWLNSELSNQPANPTVVMLHHPLQPLSPPDEAGLWLDWFVLRNADAVQAVLDAHSNVKVVLYGHHHFNKVLVRGKQIHLAAPALSSYPCAYRVLTLTPGTDNLHLAWDTVSPLPAGQQAEAKTILLNSDFANNFTNHQPEAFMAFSVGGPVDQHFSGLVSELRRQLTT